MDGLGGGVAAGDFEGLVDDDGGGGVGEAEHLGDGGAEEVAVDDGHALDAPVLGVGFDEGVDLVAAGGGDAVDVFGEAAGFGVDVGARRPRRACETSSGVCLPRSPWKSICMASSRDLRRVPIISLPGCSVGCEFALDGDHFDGGDGGFEAFVAGFEAGAVEGLLEGFAGEDAEGVGDAGLLLGLADAAGDFVVDGFVVGGFAAEEAAEGDDGVEFFAIRRGCGRRRESPRRRGRGRSRCRVWRLRCGGGRRASPGGGGR